MSEFFWVLERVLSYVWKIRGRKKGVHDRGISILEKYDLEASAASRGRGVCDHFGLTDEVDLIIDRKSTRLNSSH